MRNAHLFRIRPFEARDLDDAAAAANAACRQAYAYFGYNSPVRVSRAKLLEAQAEGQLMFVPEAAGVVTGILTLKDHFIDKLFLAPEWHGRASAPLVSIFPSGSIRTGSIFIVLNRIMALAGSMSGRGSAPSRTASTIRSASAISSTAGPAPEPY